MYLGVWNSQESLVKYARIAAELAVGGVPTAAADDDESVTCFELINSFWKYAKTRYVKGGKETSEVYLFKLALTPVLKLYGDTEIRKEHGPEIARILLGHANLNTTEIYAEVDMEAAAKAMANIG